MGWTFYNSSGQRLQTFGFVAATQAEMEAGSSTTAYVTPGRTQHHPGIAKAYCRVATAGTLATGDYNVSSITDEGTGDRTIVWDTDFGDALYSFFVLQKDAAAVATGLDVSALATGSFRYVSYNAESDAAADFFQHVVAFGDQ